MQPERLLIINPNSSAIVTDAIRSSVDSLVSQGSLAFTVVRMTKSSSGIDSQYELAAIIPRICEAVLDNAADAYVIAGFMDPGLQAVRELVSQPVVGIGESALYMALQMADRFGVISVSKNSVSRHWRLYRSLGISDRVIGDLGVESTVEGLVSDTSTRSRILAAGQELVSRGAGAVVLGCAGMASQRASLEPQLGVPVIDPVEAGVLFATGLLKLRYPSRKVD